MTSDCELLRQYAEQGEEAAFAEIVHRHMDWVYSTALRLVAGDTHLAQDIVQTVFTDCARKAGKLSHYDAPGGWLHTATRFAAAKAVDREQRRRAREQEALTMQTETITLEICWEQLRPMLDEAVGRLAESDRQIVVMRFFEGKSHREIGNVIGLSEDSARKRVERAMEKLRIYFTRRGTMVSAALLTEVVEINSVQAAPTGLAASVSTMSLTPVVATGFSGTLLSILSMTTKTKIILSGALVLLAVAAIPFAVMYQNGALGVDTPTSALEKSSPVQPSKVIPSVETPRLPPQASSGAALARLAAPPTDTSSPIKTVAASRANIGSSLAYSDITIPLGQRITALIAGAPVTIKTDLEIWEPDPLQPGTRHIRSDIEQIPLNDKTITSLNVAASGTAYFLPKENRFYIVWEKRIASTIHWYGPFDGDPYIVLGLPKSSTPIDGSNNGTR